MALTFPLLIAFIGLGALAPVLFLAALRFAVSGEGRAFGQQVIKWGAVGALMSAASADAQTGRHAVVPFTVPGSNVRFAAPTDWHVIGRDSTAERSDIFFHVRLPSDASSSDRANVMVVVRNLTTPVVRSLFP